MRMFTFCNIGQQTATSKEYVHIMASDHGTSIYQQTTSVLANRECRCKQGPKKLMLPTNNMVKRCFTSVCLSCEEWTYRAMQKR